MKFLKEIPQPIKVLFVVTLIYIVLLVILVSYNYINLGEISIGIGAGLVAWLITYLLVSWLDQDTKKQLKECLEEISETRKSIEAHDEEFRPHKQDTTTILNVVQRRYLSLVNKTRGELTLDYYFKNACEVRISGIALMFLIRSLTEQENHPLLEVLLNERDVEVKVLIAHPNSEFVQIRDMKEGQIKSVDKPCSRDIRNNIQRLSEIEKKFRNTKLPDGNLFHIRLTYAPLDSAITYIKKSATENDKDKFEEILLMGPIYYYILANKGPMYQIPKDHRNPDETTLFEHCIQNFDHLFSDASDFTVFLWNNEGIEVRRDVMEKAWTR